MKTKEKITSSIVIPNFNGERLLRKNLAYVKKAYENKNNKISEVILIDDASTDGSVMFVQNYYPEFKLVKHRVNRGFSASVNTGARTSKSEQLVLLNSDVKPEKNFLESVYKHFEDDGVFAVSLHEKGFGWAKGVFKNGFISHKSGREGKSAHQTFWVSGGSGVFRRSYWMKLKGMDEKLFKFYWEDVDLSYRAQKRGWKLLWEPNAKVEHKHESTTSKVFSKKQMSFMQEVNQLVFIWKNLTSPILFRKHLLGLIKRTSRHPGYMRVILKSLTKIRKIRKARKIEIKKAKISDEAIFARFA